jgi:hypothetical protein
MALAGVGRGPVKPDAKGQGVLMVRLFLNVN